MFYTEVRSMLDIFMLCQLKHPCPSLKGEPCTRKSIRAEVSKHNLSKSIPYVNYRVPSEKSPPT